MQTVEKKIREYIAENLLFSRKGYPYADATSFLEEGIVDSMGIMDLVTFVEENFNLEVEDQDLTPDNFDSVMQLAGYIRKKTA
ncbi:MAG: acyl carrier protein [Anaerolineae bacterium]|nr:acyl carrier protein [Anaerolineae bacterium]